MGLIIGCLRGEKKFMGLSHPTCDAASSILARLPTQPRMGLGLGFRASHINMQPPRARNPPEAKNPKPPYKSVGGSGAARVLSLASSPYLALPAR